MWITNKTNQKGSTQTAGVVTILIFFIAVVSYNTWKDAAVELAEKTLTRAEEFNKSKGKQLDNDKMLLFTKYYSLLKKSISEEEGSNPYEINLLTEMMNEIIDEAEKSVSKRKSSETPVIEYQYQQKCDCTKSRWSMEEDCRLVCGKSFWE